MVHRPANTTCMVQQFVVRLTIRSRYNLNIAVGIEGGTIQDRPRDLQSRNMGFAIQLFFQKIRLDPRRIAMMFGCDVNGPRLSGRN